jgi:hypothetical protein
MILTIFGYPKTGKTLLFNLLTGQHEKVSKYAAAGNEFHKAVIDVPDERLAKLAASTSNPAVPAKIEYVDTGAMARGQVKDSTFLDLLRRADGLVHLVRGFSDRELPHPLGSVDPERDIRLMEEELLASDYVTITGKMEKLALDMKKMKAKELQEEHALLSRLHATLEQNTPLRHLSLSEKEDAALRGYQFLSQKPLFHLINADESTYSAYRALERPLAKKSLTMTFAGKIECELLDLAAEDRQAFQCEYGLESYCYLRAAFIQASYRLMDLISFFTIGKAETKAWTINRGSNAWTAAGKIHSDIQRGFVRAEVIGWQEFLASGGFAGAAKLGTLRLEGKEYVIADGEVIHFRFNV